MSPKLRHFITTLFLFFVGIAMYGQDGPPPPATRAPVPVGLPPVPIDEHISLLLIMGVVIGVLYFLVNKSKVTISTP